MRIHTTVNTLPFRSIGILRAIPGTIQTHRGRLMLMSKGNGIPVVIRHALRLADAGTVHSVL